MKQFFFPISLVLVQAFAVNAFAESNRETDAAQSKAAPAAKATPEDKAAARAARRAEGRAVARSNAPEVEGVPDPGPLGAARKASKDERKVMGAQRRAATTEAARRGEITHGEK
ncbi:MAG TPA: hypothetical protein VLI46_03390 [Ramlibacter sp.]|nr:hypothetical protein [Ramlibacter sp.]